MKHVVSWDIAKELLTKDVCTGLIHPKMGPNEIYKMRDEYYQEVEYTKFRQT